MDMDPDRKAFDSDENSAKKIMPVRPDPDPQHRMKLLPYTDVLNLESQKIAAPYNDCE
jgi:hypothetical protein